MFEVNNNKKAVKSKKMLVVVLVLVIIINIALMPTLTVDAVVGVDDLVFWGCVALGALATSLGLYTTSEDGQRAWIHEAWNQASTNFKTNLYNLGQATGNGTYNFTSSMVEECRHLISNITPHSKQNVGYSQNSIVYNGNSYVVSQGTDYMLLQQSMSGAGNLGVKFSGYYHWYLPTSGQHSGWTKFDSGTQTYNYAAISSIDNNKNFGYMITPSVYYPGQFKFVFYYIGYATGNSALYTIYDAINPTQIVDTSIVGEVQNTSLSVPTNTDGSIIVKRLDSGMGDTAKYVGKTVNDMTIAKTSNLDWNGIFTDCSQVLKDATYKYEINGGNTTTIDAETLGEWQGVLDRTTEGLLTFDGTLTRTISNTVVVSEVLVTQQLSDLDWQYPKMQAPSLMFTKFPFCIPWDVYSAMSQLSASPVTPTFQVTLPKNVFGSDQSATIDLEMFDTLATINRWFILIVFNMMLIMVTRKLMMS